MDRFDLFQEAVGLVLDANENLETKPKERYDEDYEELVELTKFISYVVKTLFDADEHNSVVYENDGIHTWKTGYRVNNQDVSYVYLHYSREDGKTGVLRLENFIYHDDKPIYQMAYMICSEGQDSFVCRYRDEKVYDMEAEPDWSF